MNAKPIVCMPYGLIDWHETAIQTYVNLKSAYEFYLSDGEVAKVVEVPCGCARIKQLTPAEAVSAFHRHIRFVKNGDTSTSLRKEDASILLAAEPKNQLPLLKGISKHPVLRAVDGELVSAPRGYDPVTEMFYLSEPPPIVPFQKAADCIMNDLLDDFEFESQGDQGRALAHFLLPALKQAGLIHGRVPISVIEANMSGTGKGFLDALRAACYGTRPQTVTGARGGVGSHDEAFGQCLAGGNPFPQLDNMRGVYESTLLEQFATGDGAFDIRRVRVGYISVDREKYFVSITSNGFEVTEDLASRCMFIRLRHRGGIPFRQYPEGDILQHIRALESHYLGCLFAVIREWHACGCHRTCERRIRSGFHDGIQAVDWIAQSLFDLPPIMAGDREIQQRMASKHLGWLRRLCIEVEKEGRLGEEMRAAALGAVIMNANMDVPGVPTEYQGEERRVYKAIGSVMGDIFRTVIDNRVALEGFNITRETRRLAVGSTTSGTDDCKFYCIHRLDQQAEGCSPADARQPEPCRQGGEVENTPSCGPQPTDMQLVT